jgi:glycosyltransferase involved in cell wall biosynthesis
LRIAIVNKHKNVTLGGSEIQCDFIARGLSDRGHHVTYIAPEANSKLVKSQPYDVVETTPNGADIARATVSARPDIVYWRFNKNGFRTAARHFRLFQLPMVFAVAHVNDVVAWSAKERVHWRGRFVRRLRSRWEHSGFRYVDVLTVNNPDLLGRVPVPVQYYVPNGMVDDVEEFSWPRPFCVWIGNLKPAKRPEAFIELSRALEGEGVDCLMVGQVQSQAYDWVRDGLHCPSNFRYLGPKTLEEVNGILSASALHVHTCRPEGFSNVFIQAWLQGRASVSLGFDPGGYIASEGLGACAGDDHAGLLRHVRCLMHDQAERERIGARARAFATRMFSVASLVEKMESILSRTVAEKGRRAK